MLINPIFVYSLMVLVNLFALGQTQIQAFKSSIKLIIQVRNLYNPADIILIHDESELGWRERGASAVRSLSQKDIMSQSLSRTQLIEAPDEFSEFDHATGTMVVIALTGAQDYKFLKSVMISKGKSIHIWLLLAQGSYCEPPAGNPMGLRLDSRLVVYCANGFTLKRFFSLGSNKTDVSDVGYWASKTDLRVFDKSQLYVMKNLKGLALKVAEPMLQERAHHSLSAGERFVTSVFEELMSIAHFSTEVVVRFRSTRNEHLITMTNMDIIKSGKVDIGLFVTAMTAKRLQHLDFTFPIAQSRYRIFAKLPDESNMHSKSHVRVMDATETCLALATITFGVVTFLLIKLSLGKCHINWRSVIDCYLNIWFVYCLRGYSEFEMFPRLSFKIFYITILFSALVSEYIYSATTYSSGTLLKPSLPFSDYHEFFNKTNYKITTLPYSATDYFLDSRFWLYNAMRVRLEDLGNLPTDVDEAVQRICNEPVVFIAHNMNFKMRIVQEPCLLDYVKLPLIELLGIILTKDSPYTDVINYNILRLSDIGIIKRLKQYHFYKPIDLPKNEPNFVSLDNILMLLVLWAWGVLASLLVLFAEIILCKRQRLQQRCVISRP